MAQKNLNVLIIGSGGREHAILNACLKSPLVKKVLVAPGNGGMEQIESVQCPHVDVENPQAILHLAQSKKVDFVIIGPEVPLALGAADVLRDAGITTFGPGADGARLESSKAFCKDFFDRYDIPTAKWQKFTEIEPALAYLPTLGYPLVVKASGLAAGKGVIICQDQATAEDAVRCMLEGNAFGESGHEIVIEEFLQGEEASIMVMVSGNEYVSLPPSQDHKRIGEGDTGPNTGGMGAYAPAHVVTPDVMDSVHCDIIRPTLEGFQREGIDFRGTLFVGLMIKDGIPKVLEYNVRFGDPECQVLLPLCKTDPIELMYACANGSLKPAEVEIHDQYSIIVVLAAKGYPGSYSKDGLIKLPAQLPEGVSIVHAGTKLAQDGSIRSSGGRVLGVVAMASTLEEAASKAYQTCDSVEWSDKVFRRDIGHRQLK